MFFRDPFKLMPVTQIANIGDAMCRNQIMSSNEIRQKIGLKPSTDPKADQLANPNMPQPADPNEVSLEDPSTVPPEEATTAEPVSGEMPISELMK